MAIYVNGTGTVSPQHTTGESFLEPIVEHEGLKLYCREPDYKQWFDARMLRRMGRLSKMSLAAAKICIKDSGIEKPDAVVTGTGLGCLEDSAAFITQMITQNEEALSPTPFIQSTHNTISATVALNQKLNDYNVTYSHRGFSLESSLIDAMMLLEEGINNVLTGAYDEIIDYSFLIQQRLKTYKNHPVKNTGLLNDKSEGTVAGEGATFFMLGKEKGANCYAELKAVHMLYKPQAPDKISEAVAILLKEQNLSTGDIDLLILGKNGDTRHEDYYDHISKIFPNSNKAAFKHLCGEYQTASGFALWMANMILKKQNVPAVAQLLPFKPKPLRNILIYNHYKKINHSLILLSAC